MCRSFPFSKDVNVGANNYAATWIDWTDWEAEPPYMGTWLANSSNKNTWEQTGPGDSCPLSNSSHGFRCTTGPSNGASNTNTIPSSGSYKGYICPSIDNGNKISSKASVYYNGCYDSEPATRTISSGWGASCGGASNCSCSGSGGSKVCTQSYYQHKWRQPDTAAAPSHSTWNGCMVDRGDSGAPNSGNYDTNVTAPDTTITATLFSAEQYSSCPQAVMPLSYDWTTMKNLVDNMSPAGNTNQAIGLAHGWMSLVGGGPYPTPAGGGS